MFDGDQVFEAIEVWGSEVDAKIAGIERTFAFPVQTVASTGNQSVTGELKSTNRQQIIIDCRKCFTCGDFLIISLS